jgi:hypothetical protein
VRLTSLRADGRGKSGRPFAISSFGNIVGILVGILIHSAYGTRSITAGFAASPGPPR